MKSFRIETGHLQTDVGRRLAIKMSNMVIDILSILLGQYFCGIK